MTDENIKLPKNKSLSTETGQGLITLSVFLIVICVVPGMLVFGCCESTLQVLYGSGIIGTVGITTLLISKKGEK